jgi:hypothetical protein
MDFFFFQKMEAKSDTCSSQKYECGDGDTNWLATLAENNLQYDTVSQLEDGGTFPTKSDTCSSQKYDGDYGDMDWIDMLVLSYFTENNLQYDAVLRLDDGGTFPVNRETLSKCSEYFRFVWLLIWFINM